MDSPFVWGALGALVIEVLKAKQKHSALTKAEFRKLYRDPFSWIFAIAMVPIGGIVAAALLDGPSNHPRLSAFTFGVAAEAIARQLSANGVAALKVPAGESALERLRRIFL